MTRGKQTNRQRRRRAWRECATAKCGEPRRMQRQGASETFVRASRTRGPYRQSVSIHLRSTLRIDARVESHPTQLGKGSRRISFALRRKKCRQGSQTLTYVLINCGPISFVIHSARQASPDLYRCQASLSRGVMFRVVEFDLPHACMAQRGMDARPVWGLGPAHQVAEAGRFPLPPRPGRGAISKPVSVSPRAKCS